MSATDWQTEILGDRAAMVDALKDLVPDERLGEAATYVTARLAQERNGTRLLIRSERYEELERAEEQLSDVRGLARSLYLGDPLTEDQKETLTAILFEYEGEL